MKYTEFKEYTYTQAYQCCEEPLPNGNDHVQGEDQLFT